MLILTACLSSHLSYSQKITNVDFEVIGNTVKISYDIDGCSGDKNYDIRLSVGKDGELTEISRGLSGDIKNVPCGPSNIILWDVLSDRQRTKGPDLFWGRDSTNTSSDAGDMKRSKGGKSWSRRSWKADKGYVGGSIGVFAPYENYSHALQSFEQNGFFLNTTIGYLPTLLLGVSTTIYFYGASRKTSRITTWETAVL